MLSLTASGKGSAVGYLVCVGIYLPCKERYQGTEIAMWKKVLQVMSSLLLAVGLCFSSTAPAAEQYEEGVNYQVRSEKLSATQEVREFFSFWCGHCFAMQPDFDAIAKAFPQANFVRNPVSMLGGMMGPESQRAVAVMSNLGMEDLFVHELFTAMHSRGEIPMSHDDLLAFVTTLGVSRDKFEREFNSFPVIGRVAQYDKWCQDVNIEAVPELLVNGKYLVTMESVNNREELIALIGYLLQKDNVPAAK